MSIVAHKIELDPTPRQARAFQQAVGCARFAYNWALATWQAQYARGGSPNEVALRKLLNEVKRGYFPWMLDAPKSVVQQAVKNLGASYDRFFKKLSKHPRKKKRGVHDSCRLDNGPDTFRFEGKTAVLPKYGRVKMREQLRFSGRPLSCTLSKKAGRWFLSVSVETADVPPQYFPESLAEIQAHNPSRTAENQSGAVHGQAVGLDLGVKTAVVLSDGTTFEAPKPLKAALERLARAQRSLCRKAKGSENRRKARERVARIHYHVAEVRRDWTHKVTRWIADRYSLVLMENLNVRGMVKNHCLARAISDVGFYELRRQLEYKTCVVTVNRFYPSSKTCSCCGHIKQELALDERVYSCESCKASLDRDVNAAINILREGARVAAQQIFSAKAGKIPRVTRDFKPVETSASTRAVGASKQESTKQESKRLYVLRKG